MELDDTDKGILFLLQQDARDATTTEIADRVGVSASTVRNRIERLEDAGIVRGYYPDIDYEAAGSNSTSSSSATLRRPSGSDSRPRPAT